MNVKFPQEFPGYQGAVAIYLLNTQTASSIVDYLLKPLVCYKKLCGYTGEIKVVSTFKCLFHVAVVGRTDIVKMGIITGVSQSAADYLGACVLTIRATFWGLITFIKLHMTHKSFNH